MGDPARSAAGFGSRDPTTSSKPPTACSRWRTFEKQEFRLMPAQFVSACIGTQGILTGICCRQRNVAVGANQVRRILEVARCRGLLAPSERLESEPERFACVAKVIRRFPVEMHLPRSRCERREVVGATGG